MASWHLNSGSAGIDHTYDGANLHIRTDAGVTPLTIARASITDYLGEILSTADDFNSARRPQSRYRRILNSTGWTESFGSTTMSYPHAAGGVRVTVTATSETYNTGDPAAYCQNILSICELDMGPFQKATGASS